MREMRIARGKDISASVVAFCQTDLETPLEPVRRAAETKASYEA